MKKLMPFKLVFVLLALALFSTNAELKSVC